MARAGALKGTDDPSLRQFAVAHEQDIWKTGVITRRLPAPTVGVVRRKLRVGLPGALSAAIVLEQEAETLVAAAVAPVAIRLAAPALASGWCPLKVRIYSWLNPRDRCHKLLSRPQIPINA